MRYAWLPLLALAALTAKADGVAPGMERIPVIHLTIDGPKAQTVQLLIPPTKDLLNLVCIREFNATSIRCYTLHFKTTGLDWVTFDLDLKD